MIRGTIRAALGGDRFESSMDGDREIIWPNGRLSSTLPPYRGAGSREHTDIPLPELASLAASLRSRGNDDEEIVRGMQEHFSLGRLASVTRERFEAAMRMSKGQG